LSFRYHRARVLLDATGHDQMVSELKREGVRAEGYVFHSASKQELIDGLVIALEQGDLRLPHHPALIRELTEYRFETQPSGTVKLGAPDRVGSHDDLVTALALATYAARQRRSFGLGALDLNKSKQPEPQDVWEVLGLHVCQLRHR
jgi:hypothetical protein